MPWIVSAGFDNVEEGKFTVNRDKLLKPGKSYSIGRINRDFNLNSSKIRKERSITLRVEQFTSVQVADPAIRPKLILENGGVKPKAIHRWSSVKRKRTREPDIPPETTQELQSDDTIQVGEASVSFRWEPVVCFVPLEKGHRSLYAAHADDCASLGVHLLNNLEPCVTFHVQRTVKADAHFCVEWLQELLRRGALPRLNDPSKDSAALEDRWKLPSPQDYPPSLPPTFDSISSWMPDETRLNMFAAFRFLCVGEKPRYVNSDMRAMLEKGGGQVEVFDVHDSVSKFRKAVSRGKAKQTRLILVAQKTAVLQAIGEDSWREFEDVAEEYEVVFISTFNLVKAVIIADTSVLISPDEFHANEPQESIPDSLPSVIPNSLPDEPSQLPESGEKPPRRKLARRVASRQASQEPSQSSEPQLMEESIPGPEPKPRRALTRRVYTHSTMITGLEGDPISSLAAVTLEEDNATTSKPPSQSQGTRRPLKRRVGPGATQETRPTEPDVAHRDESAELPATKKYREFYHATDPSKMASQEDIQRSWEISQQQSQSVVDLNADSPPAEPRLPPVREEEEESQSQHAGTSQAKKRKASSSEAIGGDSLESQAKRRAIEDINAVQRSLEAGVIAGAASLARKPTAPVTAGAASKPESINKGSRVGAAPGHPDKDVAFLQAIASQKKGKKGEDEFDREFNNLKITRTKRGAPATIEEEEHMVEDMLVSADQQARQQEQERQQRMDEQEEAVEAVDYHPVRHRASGVYTGDNASWLGKPNFKKFKKRQAEPTIRTKSKEKIRLVGHDVGVQERMDFNDDLNQTWNDDFHGKDAPLRPHNLAMDGEDEDEDTTIQARKPSTARLQAATPKSTQKKRKAKSLVEEADSDSVEVDEAPPLKRSRSRASSITSTTTTSTRRTRRTAEKSQPLTRMKVVVVAVGQSQTLRGSTTQSSKAARSQTQRTQTQAKRKTSTATPIVVDSDSDDEGAFRRR
ncbi:hypothetical protein DL96DRAFT_1605077 [Flagelloscypha sp. PMI_526]|nr:hypothetical protein DL96DRAFT_1605077 [Flagelloscypha sp. PMI_526]